MFRGALLLFEKDLRLRVRDRSVLLFAFVVPLGLTMLFSFVLPGDEDLTVTAAVADLDGGAVADGFTQGLLPQLLEDGVLASLEAVDEDAARSLVTDGEVAVAWVIPAGTSDAVAGGEPATIEVLVADGRVLSGEVASGIARAYATEVERIGHAVGTAAASTGGPPDDAMIASVVEQAGTIAPIVTLADAPTGSGQRLDMTSYLAAGMAAFFVFFTVQWGVAGLLEERQFGTLPRLLAAPIPPSAVQVGKLLGAFALGIASMTVLTTASTVVLGASFGPSLGVAVLVVSLVVAALGVMSLVGSFARTPEQAGNLQSVVAVVLGLLGGVFFPLPGDNLLLRLLSSTSPHGWFLRGLQDLVSTGEVTAVLPAAAAICAFGVVAAIPAVVLLRRRASW